MTSVRVVIAIRAGGVAISMKYPTRSHHKERKRNDSIENYVDTLLPCRVSIGGICRTTG